MNYDGINLCGTDDTAAASGAMCKWPLPNVTWTIVADLPGFARESFKNAAALAWQRWKDVCGILPLYVESPQFANVLMGIQTIGPGNVLADSELPCGATMNSQLRQRYDTAEAWVVSDNPPSDRIDLVRVICHELGHVIGIPHIGTGNLMAPVYSMHIRKPLSGDIAEAVARYGLPSAPPPSPTPPGEYAEILAYLEKGGQLFIRRNGVIRQL